jgi:uncharacterized protein
MINGQILKQAVISGANNISNQKNSINDLNIFPVPDGDTGTNMSMTVNAAVAALEDFDGTCAGDAAGITASAMLRGARGNSGVITSLIFRGFAQGLKDIEEVDGKNLAAALGIGVDAAYKAVMKPTEGTILTVARMAYEAGIEAAKYDRDVVSVWQTIVDKSLNCALFCDCKPAVFKSDNVALFDFFTAEFTASCGKGYKTSVVTMLFRAVRV